MALSEPQSLLFEAAQIILFHTDDMLPKREAEDGPPRTHRLLPAPRSAGAPPSIQPGYNVIGGEEKRSGCGVFHCGYFVAAQLPSVLQPSVLAPLNARSQLLISAASASANWCLARGRCCRGYIAGITGKPITFYYTTLHHLQYKKTVRLKATPLITFQVKIN